MANKRSNETYWTHFIMEAYCGFDWEAKRKTKAKICSDPSLPEINKCMDRKGNNSGKICPYFLWTPVDKDERELGIRAIGKWGTIRDLVEDCIDKKKEIIVDSLVEILYTYISKERAKEMVNELIKLFKRNPVACLDDKAVTR